MTRPNEHSDNGNTGLMQEPAENEILNSVPIPPLAPAPLPEFATRAKQRAKQQIQQNRFVIIGCRCDRHGASDLCCCLHATSRRATEGKESWCNRQRRVDRGNQQRKQRQESVSDHRFRAPCHEGNAPRFSERTRPAANGNSFGIEYFADRADERGGDVGFDTHLLETRHGKRRPTSRARVLRFPTWVRQSARPWRSLR